MLKLYIQVLGHVSPTKIAFLVNEANNDDDDDDERPQQARASVAFRRPLHTNNSLYPYLFCRPFHPGMVMTLENNRIQWNVYLKKITICKILFQVFYYQPEWYSMHVWVNNMRIVSLR